MVAYNYGVDLHNNLRFVNGDLQLAEYEENIAQAIGNRLNTVYDTLDLFYGDYGSVLSSFLGWRNTDNTLKFVKLEVDNVLSQDPRLDEFSTSVEYVNSDKIRINIVLQYDEDETIELSYDLDSMGVNEVDENGNG